MSALQMVDISGEAFVQIEDYDKMSPFLMNIVSDSNHWLFATSNGGVTMGRKNTESALFPYLTDDKLIQSAAHTGSKTIVRLEQNNKQVLWEPFSDKLVHDFPIQRKIYKSVLGDKLIFEEHNLALQLSFRYHWNTSHTYGFIKKSEIINHSDSTVNLRVLDGLQGILPHGISSDLERSVSNLGDAYKRAELHQPFGIGIFSLSAMIVDRAEPSEALKATCVWSHGIQTKHVLLSKRQIKAFQQFQDITTEQDIKGEKGAYFICSDIEIESHQQSSWKLIASLNQTQTSLVNLINHLENEADIDTLIEKDIRLGTHKLRAYIAQADGLKRSADTLGDIRHQSNVLFNILRGGIFHKAYVFLKKDFEAYIHKANADLYVNQKDLFQSLPNEFTRAELIQKIEALGDMDLLRLAKEYLPLKFSRRHGDPSRPWNQFTINTINDKTGDEILDYEGNWRDLFQNWEALVYSYPNYIESMIYKFLNSSTFDGYNPYRVTKDGFDWELIEPDDPWSYIGYWGDHQIIYLSKFLEFAQKLDPDFISKFSQQEIFAYAAVPYKIKSYDELLDNPQDTIVFDDQWNEKLQKAKEELGADGALLRLESGDIYRVNMVEKLLASLLAKLSNYIPDAGIWMNTQRPEWNDANNALVGNGVSMVTLYYMRRFIKLMHTMLAQVGEERIELSSEMREYYHSIRETMELFASNLQIGFTDDSRKNFLDYVGKHASDYRIQIYSKGFWGKKSSISASGLREFLTLCLRYIDSSIVSNKREDGLYHAYNIITISDDALKISRLDEMLEGQVAALSSGFLSAQEALSVLDSLRNSCLYREDQNSYILYPNKNLPGFLHKNSIPKDLIQSSELLQLLLAEGNLDVLNQDVLGDYHFNGDLHNANDLKDVLEEPHMQQFEPILSEEKELVLDIYEKVFNHRAFTGRSGTFFAYEGLGSIYWHMVSKLLLATQESYIKAHANHADESLLQRLSTHFFAIKEGLGVHKSPELYGAFPTDAYSHTPFHRGVQQPGMTGQVKEDILVHYGEMGLEINQGKISFIPRLLHPNLFIKQAEDFHYIDARGKESHLKLSPGSLCYTLAQVPIIYSLSNTNQLHIEYIDGQRETQNAHELSTQITSSIFNRSHLVRCIEVQMNLEQNQQT
jgi:regulator of RNase E activity RraB